MAIRAHSRPVPPHPQRNTQRSRPANNGLRFWFIAGGMMTMGLMLVACLVAVLVMFLLTGEEKVPEGVTVAGIGIGGQTAEEANQTLTSQNLATQPVVFTDGDRSWTMTLADIGVDVDVSTTVSQAKQAGENAEIQPVYYVDLNKTQEALIYLNDMAKVEAVPGDPPQIGRAIEIPTVLNRLYTNLQGELADGSIELSMIEVEPPPLESINRSDEQTVVHVVEQGQELGLIARYYGVSIDDILEYNDLANPDILLIGQELTIPAAGPYEPNASQAPVAPTTAGKSIVVSTTDQRIYAYENGQLVHSHLVSTGLPDTPTVKGDYKIYIKLKADDMSGPDYFLPQVPYTMYFYQGYAIHGTYWHNNFGRPMSHGCVNLPTAEAEWFFNWASVGTPVRVI
jgi:lipoprotein-anchoring transpeptidase ErfK/SrfK